MRRYPFTIILKDRESGDVQPLRLKIDPGSKETGIAIINEITQKVVLPRSSCTGGRPSSSVSTAAGEPVGGAEPETPGTTRVAPVRELSQELVRFDLQKNENPAD